MGSGSAGRGRDFQRYPHQPAYACATDPFEQPPAPDPEWKTQPAGLEPFPPPPDGFARPVRRNGEGRDAVRFGFYSVATITVSCLGVWAGMGTDEREPLISGEFAAVVGLLGMVLCVVSLSNLLIGFAFVQAAFVGRFWRRASVAAALMVVTFIAVVAPWFYLAPFD